MNKNNEIKAKIEKNYMPIIYENIKKYRKESGMSLIEVADILDMSYDYLRRIESLWGTFPDACVVTSPVIQ